MRFGSRSIRNTVNNSNTVTTTSQQSGCPDASGDGEVHFTDSAESFDCDGDEGFTFTQSTNLVNINEATDGDSILLRLDNDQTNESGSTNETAQLRFGFGSDTDVARIVARKFGDFSSAAQSDAVISFHTDADGTSEELMRLFSQTSELQGLRIGTTNTSRDASVQIVPFGTGSDHEVFILRDATNVRTLMRTTGDSVTQFGDATGGSPDGNVQVIAPGRSRITIQGSTSDAPGAIAFTDSGGSITSTLQMNNPSTASSSYYLTFASSNNISFSDEYPLLVFNPAPAQTLTLASGVTLSNERYVQFLSPTINGLVGAPAETITNAATVYIDAAPSGSNITFTNGPYALWVDAGKVRFDGDLDVAGTVTYTSATTANGNITIQKADPSLILDTLTGTDTDFWLGIQEDAGNDDDDLLQIGDGTSPGSNIHLTLNTSGNLGLGDTSPAATLTVGDGDDFQVSSTGAVTTNTTIKSTAASDLGWTVQNAANQACNTTCTTGACVVGLDTSAVGNFLACTDATADTCLCAG